MQGSDGHADLIILELVMCQAPQGALPSSPMLPLVRHFQRYKVPGVHDYSAGTTIKIAF